MIERYSREAMKQLWSDQHKFETYLKVELWVDQAWCELGEIPKDDMDKLWANASFDLDRINQLEAITHHDVVAFTRAVSETLGDEKKWIHYGLTSTDVVDTAYGCLYQQANTILEDDLIHFMDVLKTQALKYKYTPCMGRTHGVHAEITSFGLKFALWYEEMKRHMDRFHLARKQIEAGKISGAVGTFANCPSFIQDYVCEHLGLTSAAISTQILQRDRHAYYLSTLALIASSLEKMATEIRHLQRTEVREVEEHFAKGQKGSSAMPHKRNPIGCENICGCARVMRGYSVSAMEDINLWHERDISHSSAERIIGPDATTLLDYMLHRFSNILENLTVFEDRMLKNIDLTHDVIFSQRFVLALIEKGCSREQAYDLVQKNAMKAWEDGVAFKELMEAEPLVRSMMSQADIDDCFDIHYHLRNVDEMFKRVGIDG